MIPEGAKGINPNVLLATLQAESGFGTTSSRYFGALGKDVPSLDFEAQLNLSVNQYIMFYYYALYVQKNDPSLFKNYIVTGAGGSYVPANAAMFSRGQYNTDALSVLNDWQKIYRERAPK